VTLPYTVAPRSFLGLARRSFPFWFGGIWLVCGAPFLVVGIYVAIDTVRQEQRYTTEAQVTEGMVLTKRISRGNKESTSYMVSYRFRAPDGAVVQGDTKTSGALWDRLVERGPIRVTYLADRPWAHRIEDQGPDWILPLAFTVVGSVLVPLGGWIFARGLRGIMRELRLQRDGTRAEATVMEVEPADVAFNGVAQWRIRYRYRDHGGRERHGESALLAPEEAEQWKAGDKGVARFDVHAPGKSIWVGKA
jgi:hypothetical protein